MKWRRFNTFERFPFQKIDTVRQKEITDFIILFSYHKIVYVLYKCGLRYSSHLISFKVNIILYNLF